MKDVEMKNKYFVKESRNIYLSKLLEAFARHHAYVSMLNDNDDLESIFHGIPTAVKKEDGYVVPVSSLNRDLFFDSESELWLFREKPEIMQKLPKHISDIDCRESFDDVCFWMKQHQCILGIAESHGQATIITPTR